MTDERHPIHDFLDANGAAVSALFLYAHPEIPIEDFKDETFEEWIVEILDEGMRAIYDRAHQDLQARMDDFDARNDIHEDA